MQTIHGGDIYRNRIQIDFSVNINPLGIPEEVKDALHQAVDVCMQYPDMEAEITAYAATSNMLSSVDGLYMSLFIALPMCEFMYKLFTKNNRHYKDGLPIGAKVKVKAAGEE